MTVLDINMGYYTIRLFPEIQVVVMIGTAFGKFGSNRLSMVMFALVDIFQSNVYELLGDIKVMKTYTDNVLV